MVCDILLVGTFNTFEIIWEGGEIMLILVIISLAGISLYFLLKPPTDFQYEQALRCESISEPELVIIKKQNMPPVRGFG
jgi:hypothetical protein